jgi:hypothetical protein
MLKNQDIVYAALEQCLLEVAGFAVGDETQFAKTKWLS